MEMNDSDQMAQRAIESLSALASSHRLAVFRVLVRAGNTGLSAGDIASRLDMPASSLSFHLSHLRQAELVIDKRVGRSIIYRANFGRAAGDCEDADAAADVAPLVAEVLNGFLNAVLRDA